MLFLFLQLVTLISVLSRFFTVVAPRLGLSASVFVACLLRVFTCSSSGAFEPFSYISLPRCVTICSKVPFSKWAWFLFSLGALESCEDTSEVVFDCANQASRQLQTKMIQKWKHFWVNSVSEVFQVKLLYLLSFADQEKTSYGLAYTLTWKRNNFKDPALRGKAKDGANVRMEKISWDVEHFVSSPENLNWLFISTSYVNHQQNFFGLKKQDL